MTDNKLYSQAELDRKIDEIVRSRLEDDIKEIQKDVKFIKEKLQTKLLRLETTVYIALPIIFSLIGYKILV